MQTQQGRGGGCRIQLLAGGWGQEVGVGPALPQPRPTTSHRQLRAPTASLGHPHASRPCPSASVRPPQPPAGLASAACLGSRQERNIALVQRRRGSWGGAAELGCRGPPPGPCASCRAARGGRRALQAAGGFLVRKKGGPGGEGRGVGYLPTPLVSQERGLCLWVTEELILRSGG